MGYEHFWTSGTDQGEEGKFYWMSTGQPLTYENWNSAEPNNFMYVNSCNLFTIYSLVNKTQFQLYQCANQFLFSI